MRTPFSSLKKGEDERWSVTVGNVGYIVRMSSFVSWLFKTLGFNLSFNSNQDL